MTKTVSQLKMDLSRDISPASPTDSRDLNGALEQGAEEMLSYIKPKDLSKRVIVENALYDQVNRYNCPDDLDTNKIMEWYRLKNNQDVSDWYQPMRQVTNMAFDSATRHQQSNNMNIFTIEYQSGKKFIKVSDFHGDTGYTLAQMNSINEDGLWQTFGNVTNLASDNLTYVSGSGSLRFDINDSSSIGGIENFTMTPFDITEFLNVGKIFSWLDIPNMKQIQTVTLELYSSLTDYYQIQISSPHDTDEFQLGWNLMGFELDRTKMNTIGTPNPAAINHIKVTFVTNGTLNMESVRMDNIVARKGVVYGIQYVSNQIFQDVDTGLMRSRPLNDSDVIILEYNTYQVYRAHCAVVLAQELVSSNQDLQRIDLSKTKAINVYKNKNKEEYIDETQTLHRFGVNYGYQNYDNYRTHYNHGDDVSNP